MLGYLQSLWVDSKGNLREDSNTPGTLDINTDNIIEFYFDSNTQEARAKRYAVSSANPFGDGTGLDVSLDSIKPIWEAGNLLKTRNASDRKIFTYIGDGDALD